MRNKSLLRIPIVSGRKKLLLITFMHLLTFDMKNHQQQKQNRSKSSRKYFGFRFSVHLLFAVLFLSVFHGTRSKANRPSWSLRQLQILHLWWLNLIFAGSRIFKFIFFFLSFFRRKIKTKFSFGYRWLSAGTV